MDAREIIVAFIDSCLKSQIISQADILKICAKDGSPVRGYPSYKQVEEVVNHLNSVDAISDNNLSNYCRARGIKIRVRATLRKCLRLRKFKFTQRRGSRTYYVKAGSCPEIVMEDIII